MGSLFSSPDLPETQTTTTATTVAADPAIEEARRKELIAAQKSKGRAATLLTGSNGDTSDPSLATKRLLGQ